MMSRYPLPGVYQEDQFPPARPPLRTGVAIFLAQMPFVADTNTQDEAEIAFKKKEFYKTPVEITSEFGFNKTFPQASSETFLKAALYGFFRNGGLACHVMPVREITRESVVHALAVLEELEDGDLLCMPDLMWAYQQSSLTAPDVISIQSEILAHCARVSTRFAIFDALPEIDLLMQQRQVLIQMAGRYAALYYPWILPTNTNGVFVPPSGHIAGTYAHSDYSRGVHKAPANEIIEDVLDVSQILSVSEQEQFVQRHLNYIIPIRGRGIRAWGAYTLSTNQDWKYLTTSRLFCKMARWVHRFLLNAVFENNDIYLWTYIEASITLYLYELVQEGEIKNFFVRCNAETNPPAERDSGIVHTQIGLAPAFPAEFIIVRVMHGESGVSFSIDNNTTI